MQFSHSNHFLTSDLLAAKCYKQFVPLLSLHGTVYALLHKWTGANLCIIPPWDIKSVPCGTGGTKL